MPELTAELREQGLQRHAERLVPPVVERSVDAGGYLLPSRPVPVGGGGGLAFRVGIPSAAQRAQNFQARLELGVVEATGSVERLGR